MKFLVTGGAGFIGSTLVRKLVQNANNLVLSLDNLSCSSLNTINDLENLKNYNFINSDINDKKELLKILFDFQPDYVFHLAAESHVDRSIENPKQFLETNIIGTFNLVEAFCAGMQKNLKGFRKFIHISTDEVFGSLQLSDSPFKETHKYKPNSPYAASKASSDHIVRAWGKTYKMPYVVTNCSNNFGPYQFPEKFIPHTIINALKGNEIPIYGDGKQIRDWLFVEDHVTALLEICMSDKLNTNFNIGGNCELKNIDLARMLCSILDKEAPLSNKKSSYSDLISFVEDRPGHDTRYAIDSSKLSDLMSWRVENSFNKNLISTVKWYINNKDWWEKILLEGYNLQRIGKLK